MVESQSMGSPRKKKILKRKAGSASPLLNKSAKLSLTHELEANDLPLLKESEGQKKDHEVKFEGQSLEEIGSRYPVLKNEELVKKFLSVSLTNNQKGRIRQLLKDNLKGTSSVLLPDVIHNRILSILRGSTNLNDTELRKVRILYNMLKTAIAAEKKGVEKKTSDKKAVEKKKKLKKLAKESKEVTENDEKEKKQTNKPTENKEQLVKKVKGKKRYVVFLGNLPVGVNKDMIMQHFSEMNEHIIDIRIPKPKEEKKSAIAYVELRNEPTYELALSKHHSMMGSKRIRVLYTTQKNGKITKGEAKSKSAKLLALQKSGMLIGSTPLNRKRSQRRLKAKKARAKQEGHSV